MTNPVIIGDATLYNGDCIEDLRGQVAELLPRLRNGAQIDAEGVFVGISRQVADDAADMLEKLLGIAEITK